MERYHKGMVRSCEELPLDRDPIERRVAGQRAHLLGPRAVCSAGVPLAIFRRTILPGYGQRDPYSSELDEFEENVLLHFPVVVLDRRGGFRGLHDHAIEPAVMLACQRAQQTHEAAAGHLRTTTRSSTRSCPWRRGAWPERAIRRRASCRASSCVRATACKGWDKVAAAAAVRFEEAAYLLGRVSRCLLEGDALVLLARQLLVAFVLRRRGDMSHHGGTAA